MYGEMKLQSLSEFYVASLQYIYFEFVCIFYILVIMNCYICNKIYKKIIYRPGGLTHPVSWSTQPGKQLSPVDPLGQKTMLPVASSAISFYDEH